MGGQRNSKLLRLVVGSLLVFFAMYVLYGYWRANNDVAAKVRHLKAAEDEFQALSRRFDMLGNELKGKKNYSN